MPPTSLSEVTTMKYEFTKGFKDYPYYMYNHTYDDIYDYNPEPCIIEDMKTFNSWFLPTFFTFLYLFGLKGNVLVILILLKYQRLKNVTNIYLFNLAISDLLFVGALPFLSYFIADEWIFGEALCKITACIYQFGFFSSSFFIMLMALDRYFAIVHSTIAVRKRSVFCCTIASISMWLVAFLLSIPELIIHTVIKEGDQMICIAEYSGIYAEWELFISLENNLMGLILPLLILFFCYTQTVRTLLSCRQQKKIKATGIQIIFTVIITFVLFWCPFNMVFFMRSLIDVGVIEDCHLITNLAYAMQFTRLLAFFHCGLNPVIYFFMGPKFKEDIKRYFAAGCVTGICKPCRIKETVSSLVIHQGLARSPSSDIAL